MEHFSLDSLSLECQHHFIFSRKEKFCKLCKETSNYETKNLYIHKCLYKKCQERDKITGKICCICGTYKNCDSVQDSDPDSVPVTSLSLLSKKRTEYVEGYKINKESIIEKREFKTNSFFFKNEKLTEPYVVVKNV